MKKITALICFLTIFSYLYPQNAVTYIPYQKDMREIVTDNFVVIFPQKYSEIAYRTANYAENIHNKLKKFVNWKPHTKTTIILTDHTDYPNGLASVILRNYIILYLAPSDLAYSLKDFEDPLYSLILHEYAHIMHLDQIRGGAFFWRALFGKLYHPVINTFNWYIEGFAVLSETLGSKGGRLTGTYNNAIVKEAAKNKAIPNYDTLIYPIVDFPHGDSLYHFGAKFLEYLYKTYGKEKFDQIYLKLSSNFFPFIFMFNLNFKSIYGKTLNALWKEWKQYEENLVAKEELERENQNSNLQRITPDRITDLNGKIEDFDIKNGGILISSVSYKNDNMLYILKNNKLTKIKRDYYRSITFTNLKNFILYTKPARYFDEFEYFDLYSYNLKTKKEIKFTNKERVNYVTFAKESQNGLYVTHSPLGTKVYKATFKDGFIYNKHEIVLDSDITFADKPSISNDGSKAIISTKNRYGELAFYQIDLFSNKIQKIESLSGRYPDFINDDTFLYIAEENGLTKIMKYDITTSTSTEIFSSYGIFKAKIDGDKIFYTKYTIKGVELFSFAMPQNVDDIPKEVVLDDNSYDTLSDKINPEEIDNTSANKNNDFKDNTILKNRTKIEFKNYDVKRYNPFRNWYPTLWALTPAVLPNSNFVIESGKDEYIAIPIIAPSIFLFNQSTLGRVSYNISVTYDYLRQYPINSLSLYFKNPYISISYNWSNWMGDSYNYLATSKGNGFSYKKYNGRFPINFSNQLTLSSSFDINNYSKISFSTTLNHSFNEYNKAKNKLTNTLIFSENFNFYYINQSKSASRWDRGLLFGIQSVQSISGLLDNNSSYIITTSFTGRIPFKNNFVFINNYYGIDIFLNDSFSAGNSIFRLNEKILGGTSIGDSYRIDMKAFTKEFTKISSGAIFGSLDMGIDISIYKKSHYLHFLTMGFREFYMRLFSEFTYLYNTKIANELHKGILFDQALELSLDLFVGYGIISLTITNGFALGYRVGDTLPSLSGYCYLGLGL